MAWQPAYCTDTELESWIQDGSGANSAELLLAIEAASRSVDKATNRQFGLVASAEDRYYTAEYDRRLRRWVIEIDDLMTATGLEINVDLDSDGIYDDEIDNYDLTPINASANSRPWTQIIVDPESANLPTNALNGVKVTARYGWTTVPDTIKLATMIQASRLFARRNAPFGVAGNPEVGEMRLLEKLDVDLMTSVQSYVRRWGAV